MPTVSLCSAGQPPRPADWSGFFVADFVATADFMMEYERMPIQERALNHLSVAIVIFRRRLHQFMRLAAPCAADF